MMKERRILSEPEIAEVMRQLLSAIAYCHSEHVAHRNIKLENIHLISDKDEPLAIKLGDFEFATEVYNDEVLNEQVGTLNYMAPEIFNGNYNKECDIWSCGVIMYLLACGRQPFTGSNEKAILNKITTRKLSFKGK